MGLLKVSSRSNPNAVAGAFAGVVREHGRVEVQVVGAGALNQATVLDPQLTDAHVATDLRVETTLPELVLDTAAPQTPVS